MGWIIVAIGAICSACGGWLAYSGYEIIQVERGWAMVISGATLFSAGVIALSLGLLALKLTSLAKSFPRAEALGPAVAVTPKPWTKALEPAVLNATEPHVPETPPHLSAPVIIGAGAVAAVGAAALVEQSDLFSGNAKHENTGSENIGHGNTGSENTGHETAQPNLADHVLPIEDDETHTFMPPEKLKPEPVESTPKLHIQWPNPVISPSVPADETPALPEPPAPSLDWLTAALKHPPEPQDLLPDLQRQSSVYETSLHASESADALEDVDTLQDHAQTGDIEAETHTEARIVDQAPHHHEETPHIRHQEEAAHSAALAHAPQPAVVGRYEAAGTNYAMYSDGSVEAENEHGVFRFASMSELRAFIEEGQVNAEAEPAAT